MHRGRVRWHLRSQAVVGLQRQSRRLWTLLLSLMVSYLFGIPIRHRTLGQDRQPTVSLRLGFDKTSKVVSAADVFESAMRQYQAARYDEAIASFNEQCKSIRGL